jgi:hypothetical protein
MKEKDDVTKSMMNMFIEEDKGSYDCGYIDDVSFSETTVNVQVPYRAYSVGKEIKHLLKLSGVEVKGRMNTYLVGDYKIYEFILK